MPQAAGHHTVVADPVVRTIQDDPATVIGIGTRQRRTIDQ
jgi:hypothetical protein